MSVHIGISGWTYPPWRNGAFYPKGLAHRRELEYASRQVGSIEINGSFYSLQKPESYQAWYEATPEDFVFSVKGGRFITHFRQLREVEIPLANFFASGVLALREKLGPILWQLPPRLRYDKERLEAFLKLLPHTTRAAVYLAKKHDHHLDGRVVLSAPPRRLRHALEVRHESFAVEDCVHLLRKHNVALVVADTAGKWPYMEDITSDFMYVRLHGDKELYASGYGEAALKHWAARIRAWTQGRTPARSRLVIPHALERKGGSDVYVYFDNDVKVHAPFDAMSLARRLKVSPASADEPQRA